MFFIHVTEKITQVEVLEYEVFFYSLGLKETIPQQI